MTTTTHHNEPWPDGINSNFGNFPFLPLEFSVDPFELQGLLTLESAMQIPPENRVQTPPQKHLADEPVLDFAQDLLKGAKAISRHIYGDEVSVRKVYHLCATSKLPIFKLGSMLCARKSVLLKFIAEQESRHTD